MFAIGFIVGAIVMAIVLTIINVRRSMKETELEEELDGLRRPTTEAQARRQVEKAGPVPSDLDLDDFIGSPDETRKEAQRKHIKEKWEKGLEVFYQYLLNQTKDEDANVLLHYIAKQEKDTYLSGRKVSADLKWGFRRYAKARDYLLRNRYIAVADESFNRGTLYQLTEKSNKKQ